MHSGCRRVTERDRVQTRRGNRIGASVPLVQLQDPGYEQEPQLPLVDDGERKALAAVVRREAQDKWRRGMITEQDRKQARIWAGLVAVAAVGGMGVSILDLVLHLIK
jgi:hypothetical protein